MKLSESQLRKIIRETRGGLPMSVVRQTGGYGPKTKKEPFLAVWDWFTGLDDPDTMNEFKMLVLDMGLSTQEVAENFPQIAQDIMKLNPKELNAIARDL